MAQATLTPQVKDEITRLSETNKVDAKLLEEFAYFVVKNSDQKSDKTVKPLSIDELKTAIYNRFRVKNTDELKRSGAFKMATEGMEKLNFRFKSSWELMYRKFIGILPHEQNQEGYGCINGIDVFQYFKPWQVFDLDPKTATKDDIKKAYYRLSKIYHPDNPETGDRQIFEQIEIMYKSIVVVF